MMVLSATILFLRMYLLRSNEGFLMGNCFTDFLQRKGLYDSIAITESNIDDLLALIEGKIKLSEYCCVCKEMRVFTMEPITFVYKTDEENIQERLLSEELKDLQHIQQINITPRPGEKAEEDEWFWTNWQTEKATRVMVFSFICAMDDNHHLDYIVQTNGSTMIKIGQFPSVADLALPELDEFKKDIEKESMREFRRAIGLHAQGIGVGSFVYLRRIFERIVDKAKQNAEVDATVDLSNYESMRVAERIKLLKEYLPDMISSSPVIYGIVSKGIHELSEDECISFFPVLKEAIIIILRQWAQKRKEQEAIKKLESSISSIATELLQ